MMEEANANPLVQPLFDGPLDIIGDVHGEWTALCHLLERLGYPREGPHPEGRRLVYVGDLVDRGPNSPAVVEHVIHQVENGWAQCVLGNHELNLIESPSDEPPRHHGNHWFWDEREPIGPGQPFFGSIGATPKQRERFLAFFRSLPLALERHDLRVVHACWDTDSIESIRTETNATEMFQRSKKAIWDDAKQTGLAKRSRLQRQQYQEKLRDAKAEGLPLLHDVADLHTRLQIENPIKVLSSGLEVALSDPDQPYFIGGKWRMTRRVAWWTNYQDFKPVIFGHYWRKPVETTETTDHHSLFPHDRIDQWLGPRSNCYCIDLSVGRRFQERAFGRKGALSEGALAAVRIPEWQVVMDDRPTIDLSSPNAQ